MTTTAPAWGGGWGGPILEMPIYQISGTDYTLKLFDVLAMGGGAVLIALGLMGKDLLLLIAGVVAFLLGFVSAFVPGGIGV